MSVEEAKGKEEKTTACSGFERMFEMMNRCCASEGGLPDCRSMMSMMEKCCRPNAETGGEGSQG